MFKGEQSVPKAELVAILEATQAPKQTGEKDMHIFTDSLNSLLNLKKMPNSPAEIRNHKHIMLMRKILHIARMRH